jgi:hypothetical protein
VDELQMTPNDARGDFLARATVWLVVLVIVFVFALVFMSAFGLKADPSLMTLVGQVVATTLGFGVTLWGFQWGSSKGSQAKDALVAAMSPPTQTPPAIPTVPGPATALVIQPTT